MAMLIKNRNTIGNSAAGSGPAVSVALEQWVHVKRGAAVLPATTTQNLFKVVGGRIVIKALIGTVTTVMSGTATNLKFTAVPSSGTAVDLSANAAVTSKEVGATYLVKGGGAAGSISNAGAAIGAAVGDVIESIAFVTSKAAAADTDGLTIRCATDATNTGAMAYDLWYIPLDPAASVQVL